MATLKFNSVSEGIALRLNQIAGNLSPLGLAFDPTTGLLRCTVISGTLAVSSLPTLGTVTTVTGVTGVTGVTTVATLTNQTNIGGLSASAMVVESAAATWGATLRGRIT